MAFGILAMLYIGGKNECNCKNLPRAALCIPAKATIASLLWVAAPAELTTS